MLKGYKNAPESGSLSISPIPPPGLGGAGALNDLGRTAKGEALFNSLLWGWLPGYDVSSMGSWVSTKEYGVERVYSCSMSRKSITHLGWLMPVPYPSQVGINWSPNAWWLSKSSIYSSRMLMQVLSSNLPLARMMTHIGQ